MAWVMELEWHARPHAEMVVKKWTCRREFGLELLHDPTEQALRFEFGLELLHDPSSVRIWIDWHISLRHLLCENKHKLGGHPVKTTDHQRIHSAPRNEVQ
jgi:hypothetical protein